MIIVAGHITVEPQQRACYLGVSVRVVQKVTSSSDSRSIGHTCAASPGQDVGYNS
jgi:hypothetical protein